MTDRLGGVHGCLVTGKGAFLTKSIFLPAAGLGRGSYLGNPSRESGNYWSSTPNSGDSYGALYLYFGSSGYYFYRGSFDRYDGYSVRPLRESAK